MGASIKTLLSVLPHVDFSSITGLIQSSAFLCLQHLFPDADQDLEELEVAQQEMLFDKMENKEAYDSQGTQV